MKMIRIDVDAKTIINRNGRILHIFKAHYVLDLQNYIK